MSASTDAYLYYGLDVADEEEGLCPPAYDPETDDDLHGWLEGQVKGTGVDVGMHCCDSSPVYYLTVEGFSASRGYPARIQDLPTIPFEKKEALLVLARKLGITRPEEKIGWYLASWADCI